MAAAVGVIGAADPDVASLHAGYAGTASFSISPKIASPISLVFTSLQANSPDRLSNAKPIRLRRRTRMGFAALNPFYGLRATGLIGRVEINRDSGAVSHTGRMPESSFGQSSLARAKE